MLSLSVSGASLGDAIATTGTCLVTIGTLEALAQLLVCAILIQEVEPDSCPVCFGRMVLHQHCDNMRQPRSCGSCQAQRGSSM